MLERFDLDGCRSAFLARDVADRRYHVAWQPACDSYPRKECRIESWRERAERLEKELAVSRAETAWEVACHRAALASEGIGAMDLDEADKVMRAASDELDRLRALL